MPIPRPEEFAAWKSRAFLWSGLLLSSIFFIAGLLLIVTGQQTRTQAVSGAALMCLFGLVAVFYLRCLRARFRDSADEV